MLKHSKTTENIISTLSKLREEKKQITTKIMQSISKNNQIYDHHSLSNKKYNQSIIVNRQKSISLLEKKLNHKIKNDEENSTKLTKVEQEAIRKRQQIEKKLAQINNRNAHRIEQLKNIEEKVIKKIQEDLHKNEIKEKHLREQYIRIKNDEKKVHQTKSYQRKESFEQWKLLQAQKWRLQNLVKMQEQKQQVLIADKNPIPTKRQQKKKNEEKYIPNQKQYNKLKRPQKINSKEVGNQYLQQAKMMHRQHVMNKNKKKLMNVNLKVVGYNSDIMEKIFRNTADLSNLNKVAKEPVQIQKQQHPSEKQQTIQRQIVEQPKVKFEFKLSQDPQTERYLRQIKDNLNELQKVNKNEAQIGNEMNLLMPITNQ